MGSHDMPPVNASVSNAMEKVKKYAEEIRRGGDPKKITEGLPPAFTKAIDEALARDREAADEVRRGMGIPTQGKENAGNISEEEEKGRQIKEALGSIAGGIGEAAKRKIGEYDERIRAAKGGNPLRRGDTVEVLMDDFKNIAKQDWTEDFSLERKEARPLTAEEINEIKLKARSRTRIDGNVDLMVNPIDWELGERFDAHGIAKISVTDQLRQLLELLDKGIDPERPFFTAPLEVDPEKRAGLGAGLGTGGGTAYKDGSFIILGEVDQEIKQSGIKYVAVNDAYYDSISRLQEAYPQVRFIRADELNETLKKIAEKAQK